MLPINGLYYTSFRKIRLNPTGTLKLHVSKEDVVFLYIREE